MRARDEIGLLLTDAVRSLNYDGPDPGETFADAGTFLDLADGSIYSTGLFVDGSTGDVAIRGSVTATAFTLLDATELEVGELVATTVQDPNTPANSYSGAALRMLVPGLTGWTGPELEWVTDPVEVPIVALTGAWDGANYPNSLPPRLSLRTDPARRHSVYLDTGYNGSNPGSSYVTLDQTTTTASATLGAYTFGAGGYVSVDGTTGVVTISADQVVLSLDGLGTVLSAHNGQASGAPNINNTALLSSYGGASNIDHLWHDDSLNRWNFCSDTTYRAAGNSQLYAGSLFVTGAITSNAGDILASSGECGSVGQDGGMVFRPWTSGSSYMSVATRNMSGSEYCLLSNGAQTYLSGGAGSNIYIRPGANGNGSNSGEIEASTSYIRLSQRVHIRATASGATTAGSLLQIGDNSSQGNIYFDISSGWDKQIRTASGDNTFYFRYGADAGWATVRGVISDASSRKYKRDIIPARFGLLDQALRLEPVTYRYKSQRGRGGDHGTGRMLGLIAEDVHPVAPELVHVGPQGEPEGLNALAAATLALGAVKALAARLDRLESAA